MKETNRSLVATWNRGLGAQPLGCRNVGHVECPGSCSRGATPRFRTLKAPLRRGVRSMLRSSARRTRPVRSPRNCCLVAVLVPLLASAIGCLALARTAPGTTPAGDQIASPADVQPDLEKAKALAAGHQYAVALATLDSILQRRPDNDEAKRLRAQWQEDLRAGIEEAERERVVQRQAQRPEEYFRRWMLTIPESRLSAEQQVTANGTLGEVEAKLLRAMTNQQPAFKVESVRFPEPELFRLETAENLGSAGQRRCALVGGQTSATEVTLLFEVMEYASSVQATGRPSPGKSEGRELVPLAPSRFGGNQSYVLQRRQEGIQLVRRRILSAVQG